MRPLRRAVPVKKDALRSRANGCPRWRLGLVAALLVLGPWLGTHWWSAPRGRRLDFTPPAHLALWEPEPLTDDPMGATTDALLALLEGRH